MGRERILFVGPFPTLRRAPYATSNDFTLIRIVIFAVFLNLQFNGYTTKQNGTTKQRQSTMSLEEKRLHEELMNGNTNSTSHKHERTRNYSDGNVSLHVSMSETQINWAEKWHSVREFIYCETFIVGVDELSLKLFSVVFTTFNLYYWLTIFYFSDSVI